MSDSIACNKRRGTHRAAPLRVHERTRRIESLGVPVEALPDLLETSDAAIRKWVAGGMSAEEADITEVTLPMLEVRLARVMARRIA